MFICARCTNYILHDTILALPVLSNLRVAAHNIVWQMNKAAVFHIMKGLFHSRDYATLFFTEI